jgi:hypothetical protein
MEGVDLKNAVKKKLSEDFLSPLIEFLEDSVDEFVRLIPVFHHLVITIDSL